MGIKFGLSFTLNNENDRKVLREKFERHMSSTDTIKEHFERIIKYYNFHKDEIEDAIEMEKKVIPKLFYRILEGDREQNFEIRNENFPSSVTFYEKVFELKANWFYQLKEFVKKYKIINEPVVLNIDVKTREVYITIENIIRGDEDMAENKKRFIIGFNYYNEEERNTQKIRVDKFTKLSGSVNNGLKFVLDIAEMFLDEDDHVNVDFLETVQHMRAGVSSNELIENMNIELEKDYTNVFKKKEIIKKLFDIVCTKTIRMEFTGMPIDPWKAHVVVIPANTLQNEIDPNKKVTIKSRCDKTGKVYSVDFRLSHLYRIVEDYIYRGIQESKGSRSFLNMNLLNMTVVSINLNYDELYKKNVVHKVLGVRPKHVTVDPCSLFIYGAHITTKFI